MDYKALLEKMGFTVMEVVQHYESSDLFNKVFWITLILIIISAVVLGVIDNIRVSVVSMVVAVLCAVIFIIVIFSVDYTKDSIWTKPTYESYIIAVGNNADSLEELYKSFESESVSSTTRSKYEGLIIVKVKPREK